MRFYSLLMVALLAFGCGGTQVQTRPVNPTVMERAATYGWVDEEPLEGSLTELETDLAVIAKVRKLIDARLAALGYERVDAEEADLEALLALRVGKGTRENDPYFAFYTVEKFESGEVTFTLASRETGGTAWTATVGRELRVVERGFGQGDMRWVGSGETRSWSEERSVEALLAALPAKSDG